MMNVSRRSGTFPPPGDAGRSKGVHVSEIIRRIAVRMGYIEGDQDFEKAWPVMCLGIAWERYVAGVFPATLWWPGEVALDGIAGSPDGVTVEDECVEEVKFTYKSASKPLDQQWMWLAQVKAYCAMLGLKKARLHVMYVNGDYKRGEGPKPTYVVYDLEFSEQEVQDNWELILRWKGRKEDPKGEEDGKEDFG